MSAPEVIEVPEDVAKKGASAVEAYKEGFAAGRKDAQGDADVALQDRIDDVKVKATLLQKACNCIGALHEAYDGNDDSMLGAQRMAAEYIRVAFRDEIERIKAESAVENWS